MSHVYLFGDKLLSSSQLFIEAARAASLLLRADGANEDAGVYSDAGGVFSSRQN